jgi:all-beta uncharacterized protein/BACON domain-containing protein
MRTQLAALLAVASVASGCSNKQPVAPVSPSCSFSVSVPTTSFGAGGGTGTASVTTTSACTWSASSQADWVRVGGDVHTGSGSLSFTVAPSDQTSPRSAPLTIAAQAIAISQEAAAGPPPPGCAVVLTAEPDDYERDGGNGQLEISAAPGCAWALKQDESWLTIEGPLQGSGPAILKVFVRSNDAAPARRVTISAGSASAVVSQPGQGDCAFQVSPIDSVVSSGARSGSIGVNTSAGCLWSATTDASWLHLGRQAGSGSGAVTFQTDVNPAQPSRRGTIAIRWMAPTAGQNAFITQAGDCVIAFTSAPGHSPFSNPLPVGAAGGDFLFFVLSDPAFTCPWTVENSDPWIAILNPAGRVGNGDGDLHFTVAPNPSSTPRTSVIAISNARLTVVQQGR